MVLRYLLDACYLACLGGKLGIRRLHVAALYRDLAELGGHLCVVDSRRDHAWSRVSTTILTLVYLFLLLTKPMT